MHTLRSDACILLLLFSAPLLAASRALKNRLPPTAHDTSMNEIITARLTGFFLGIVVVLFTWSAALNFLLIGSLEITPPWTAFLFMHKHGVTGEAGQVLWDSMMIQVGFYLLLQLPVWAFFFFNVLRRRAELKGGH